MAVTVDAVRRLALTLPRTSEHLIRDRVKFRVGSLVYVAFSRDETLMGFAFPKEEREGLGRLRSVDPRGSAMSSDPDVRRSDMDFSLRRVDVVNLFADDLDATKTFYQEVMGLTPAFEDADSAVFKLDNLMINLLRSSAAPELIAPTEVASAAAGSRFVLAVFVDDVDATCAELERRGVAVLNGPVDRPWGMRNACFRDPAGHLWEIAQDLD